jgi:hypothetical protein
MADSKVSDLTALANVDGDELFYVVDDPSGTPADRKMTVEQLGPFRQIPYFTNSEVYLVPPISTVNTLALTANRLYLIPFWVPYRRAFTTLACMVTAFAAGNARMGVYNANQQSGQPTTLVAEGASAIDTGTSNGIRTATISQTLNPGMYYFALISDATATVRAANAGAYSATGAVIVSTTLNTGLGMYRAVTYDTLTNIGDQSAQTGWTMSAAAGGATPIIGIR